VTAVLDFGTGFTEVVRNVIREELGSGGDRRDTGFHCQTRLWEVHRDTSLEFDGELRVVAGQLRDWLRQREVVRVAPTRGAS
jgi:hypothetical protein